MSTCQARLPIGQRAPLAIIHDALGREWPGAGEYPRCGQTVGVTTEDDAYGQPWSWCARGGHRDDVEMQMHAGEKARHDYQDDMRALYGHGPAREDSASYRDDMVAAGRGEMMR